MSEREIDVDALFDRDADTQLLQRRRRQELGLVGDVAPVLSAAAARFGPESIVRDAQPAGPRAAMLRVALDARPNRELIPGAVVTVVAAVHDDGESDAPDVLLRIALPAECEAIAGSAARGDAPLDEAALFGEGVRVGPVAAGDAVRVRFAVRVLPGTGPLHVIAHASAAGVPTIAAPALRLTRRAGHAAFDTPRPFFELEADEPYERAPVAPAAPPPPPRAVDTVVDEPAAPDIPAPQPAVPEPVAADVAPEPLVADIAPEPVAADVAPEPIAPAVVVVKRAKRKPAEPKAAVAAPAEPPAAEPAPEPPSKPAPKGRRPRKRPAAPAEPEREQPYVFARALEDDGVRALERVFAGAVPHGLAALAVLTSIAAVDTPLAEALGVRDFARRVATALPRAVVAARLSQPLPAMVTRESLGVIRASAAVPDEPFAQPGPLLATRLDERELDALRTVLARDLDDVFLRGVQVLLAVAPRAVDGVDPDAAARARDALAAYRVAAGGWLMRVTVRRAVDRRYDPLVAGDASLHEAGRALVAALRGALA
jgi:hypothetical protein